MMNWPDNKRIAVMMAFDVDAETMWTTHGDGSTAHMTNLSRGAYGPKQGVPRILDMLDSHQVKAEHDARRVITTGTLIARIAVSTCFTGVSLCFFRPVITLKV